MMMKASGRLAPLVGVLALTACGNFPTGGGGFAAGGSGTLQSDVEIFEGVTFTATWRDTPSTVIRLAYEASTPVTDAEAIDIAQQLTGCEATIEGIESSLVGGLASVRIPAVCGQTAVPEADTEASTAAPSSPETPPA